MISDTVKQGVHAAAARSLFYATGKIKSEADFKKPLIAVCNSYTNVVPGHKHLQKFGAIATKAIEAAGGIAYEFNTIAVCDGIAMGHSGMRFSLPSREIIADSVETMLNAHKFDAAIFIPNCDKVTPGMLMGAIRVNIPSIFVSGGPMAAGKDKHNNPCSLSTMFEAVGALENKTITKNDFAYLEKHVCPGAGSCSGLFTANSMNCLLEVMGLALPGNGTILA